MENIAFFHIWFAVLVMILIVGISEIHKAVVRTNKKIETPADNTSLFELKLVLDDILQTISDVQTEISLQGDKLGRSKGFFDDNY